MLKTRRGSPQWVLHLADCSLFCHQNPERQKDRYLCLKRSPPWRSSAFSRLSIAILQVRFAFLHEVWLLELEGSCVSFCWCHQAVSSSHSRSSFQPGSKEGHPSLAQGPFPTPPPLPPLGCPSSCSSSGPSTSCLDPGGCLWVVFLLPINCPSPPRTATGSNLAIACLCLQPTMAPDFRVTSKLPSGAHEARSKLSLTHYCLALCAAWFCSSRTMTRSSLYNQYPEQQLLAH